MIRFLKEEPLVHFLGLAALLFVVNALFAGDPRETITVTADAQAFLIEQRQDLLLRPLTAAERQGVVDDFIEEEIFVREARARGFDASSRIRTLLIQNMRFFLASDVPAASEADYRQHYEDHPERFTTSERRTFDHVLFRDPDAVPQDLLAQLDTGIDHRSLGDQQNVTARLAGVDALQIASAFGPDVAPEILAIDDEAWHGPFLLNEGAHFLRLVERTEPRLPPYDDIRNWVESDWLAVESEKRIDDALVSMRENYKVVVEPLEAAE